MEHDDETGINNDTVNIMSQQYDDGTFSISQDMFC